MIAFVLLLSIAQTEDEPGGARVPTEEAVMEDIEEAETATTTASGCPPNIEVFYNQGFDDLLRSDYESAYAMFARVMDLCPTHSYASEMARLALAMPGGKTPTRDRLVSDNALKAETTIGEKPSLLARGELVAFQSIHGLAAGLAICAAIGCDDERALVGLGFLGTATLGGLSFALSSGVRPGQALMVNSGSALGMWHAAMFAGITEPEGETGAGMFVAGSLIGTGIGVGIAHYLKPPSGKVSFTNSAAIWSGVIGLFLMNAAEIDPFDDEEFWIGELIATDLGLVIGAIGASRLEISRGRTLLIDAGGLVGMLLGLGVAVLAEGEPEQTLVGGAGLIGTVLGLSLTFYLSRDLDAPELAAISLIPGGPRGSAGGTLAVAF